MLQVACVRLGMVILVIAVAGAGCLDRGASHESASPVSDGFSSDSVTPSPSSNVPSTTNISLVATVHDSGFSWSDCRHRATAIFYRHEWAADLVPEEYRPINTPGDLGQFRLILLACSAVSIGNQTFLPNVLVAWLGILVEAPAEVQAVGGNLFLLDIVSNSTSLSDQLAMAGAPSSLGKHSLQVDSYEVQSEEGLGLRVDEPQRLPLGGNETGASRLHWKSGDAHCWFDVTSLREFEEETRSIFSGLSGHAEQLVGPAGKGVGTGTVAVESGYMGPRMCIAQ